MILSYRDKKVVGVFVRFRAPLLPGLKKSIFPDHGVNVILNARVSDSSLASWPVQ
jgi:hypothetical protein